jgi:hydroxyacylglutathione hydrolase
MILDRLKALFGGDAGNVTPREARALVDDGNAVIVDVREPAEWRTGHIPNAVHVPLRNLEKRAKKLPRDRPIIVQCRTGNRSRVAARMLRARGFTDVRNLRGGLLAWNAQGLPVTGKAR